MQRFCDLCLVMTENTRYLHACLAGLLFSQQLTKFGLGYTTYSKLGLKGVNECRFLIEGIDDGYWYESPYEC